MQNAPYLLVFTRELLDIAKSSIHGNVWLAELE